MHYPGGAAPTRPPEPAENGFNPLSSRDLDAAGVDPGPRDLLLGRAARSRREPLIGKLLSLHRDDPDAGIHGAAECTLRRWKFQDRLKTSGAELIDLATRGDRRWFVNRSGQTFAVINGPVEFQMGSPANETERNAAYERPRRMSIPRTCAISTTEVSVEQFHQFLKEYNQTRLNREA